MVRLSLLDVLFFLLLCRNIDAQRWYPPSEGGIGAVYTMSNGATMNQILIQRINADGNLTLAGRVNTNGIGVNRTTPVVLESQGSLIVYSNYLFAVNPGSNSLSMFIIDPCDATKLKLISVQPTFGFFPISVAVNEKYACVLTTGNITGIRCFTYNLFGLNWVPSMDLNLTSYVSVTVLPNTPTGSTSDIIFSADNLALIIAVKGFSLAMPGYILFFLLTDTGTGLSLTPIKVTPTGAVVPFSLTLVGRNGLLLSDPGPNSALTLTYSSTTGIISNSFSTPLNATIAACVCWSVYSPTIGDYYVIGAFGGIVELKLNLHSNTNPVQIVQYSEVPYPTGATDATIITIGNTDYLYVIGALGYIMYGYRLDGPGRATLAAAAVLQQGDTSNLPQVVGIAAFIQPQYQRHGHDAFN